MLKKLPRNVWALTAASFFTDISSEMLFNLLPLFLANVLGVKTSVIGLIDGLAESTAGILKLYSGALSDRLGNRKWLAVSGYGLSALAKPLLYFASTWGWVLGVRFTDRIGKGIRTAPRDALLAGSVQEKERGLAFGLHRAGDTAGAFIGLAIAALVIYFSQQANATLTRATFQTIVLVSIIPGLLGVLALALLAREVTVKPGSAAPLFQMEGLSPRFRTFLLGVIFFTLGNSSDAFIILRGQERGLNVLQVMGMLLTFNAIYALLSGPLGALSDKVGRKRLILAGWTTYGLIYLGFALAQTGAQIWLLFVLYGVYYAASEGAAKAYVADLVPAERRGTAYGIFNAAIALSALPASLLAGLLWQGFGVWDGFGPSAPFLLGAVLSLLGMAVISKS